MLVLLAHLIAQQLTELMPLVGSDQVVTYDQGNSILFLVLVFGLIMGIFRKI